MKRSRLFWGVTLAALFAGAALAEKVYYTTDRQPMPGGVVHFLNASGQAVPATVATPLPAHG